MIKNNINFLLILLGCLAVGFIVGSLYSGDKQDTSDLVKAIHPVTHEVVYFENRLPLERYRKGDISELDTRMPSSFSKNMFSADFNGLIIYKAEERFLMGDDIYLRFHILEPDRGLSREGLLSYGLDTSIMRYMVRELDGSYGSFGVEPGKLIYSAMLYWIYNPAGIPEDAQAVWFERHREPQYLIAL